MKKCSSLVLGVLAVVLLNSCKKNSYLTDGGLHSAQTPLSTYEYLKQHSWQSFDTLITIIDHYNLQAELNQVGTFFAPTDYSIARYMNLQLAQKKLTNDMAKYTLDSLYKDITVDSVRQYMFKEKITLAEAQSTQPKPYVSVADTKSAVFKQLQTTSTYTQYTVGETFLLYLIKVRGDLDVPGTPPPANEVDINVQCQTTGIEPSSGGILHVLSNQHTFVRF